MPQNIYGFGPRELLTHVAGHEPPAADLASGFHAPVNLQQIPPRRSQRFVRQHVAEHDAPAIQELFGEKLASRLLFAPVQQRPSSGSVPRTGEPPSSLPAAALG